MNHHDLLNFMDDDDDYLNYQMTNQLLLRQEAPPQGGSTIGRRTFQRGHLQGDQQLQADYFAEDATYSDDMFRRRFRMHRSLFLRILNAVTQYDQYFVQRRNAAGQLGFSPYQKMTAALRMLAYGASADSLDEYIRMGTYF